MLRFGDQVVRISTGAPVKRLSAITPQLYIGGQQRKRGLERMRALGITAVVNMREARHDDLLKGLTPERYLHLPTKDNTPPSVDDLLRGVAFIQGEIARGGVVYVHCGVGVGRAPTMAAAYLIASGVGPDEALNAIKNVRPFIHLTPGQRRQLWRFAEVWRQRVAE